METRLLTGQTTPYIDADTVGHVQPASLYGNRGAVAIGGTPFEELMVAQRYTVIELKSTYGLSVLRDITTVAGSATVTNSGGEYALATTALANDAATMSSAERGRYVPGLGAEVGIGVRLPATFAGTAIARWGSFDGTNGFGFGVDATGLFVFVQRAGVEVKTYQSDWSVDRLDGTGASGLTLTANEGNIYQVQFSWYGYGVLNFIVILPNEAGRQRSVTVHRFSPTQATSVQDPNLPIRVSLANGNSATARQLYVGGRQFSVLGGFMPNRRQNGAYRTAAIGSIGTTFVPVASFRRKAAFLGVSVKVGGFDLLVDADMYYQLRLNATLTGASFTTPADTTASETACESDVSATAISGGQIIYPGGIAPASSNSNRSLSSLDGLDLDLPADQPVTLCVRRVTGTNGGVTGAVLRWREEW